MEHHLLEFNLIGSNYAPVANSDLALGITYLTHAYFNFVQILALAKNGSALRSHVLAYIGNPWNSLLVWNFRLRLSLDIWYVASSSRPLPSLFKLWPRGQKWLHPMGHIFYIYLYRANMNNSVCLKAWGLEPWYLICSFILCSSTKFVQIIPLWPKMTPLWELHICLGL